MDRCKPGNELWSQLLDFSSSGIIALQCSDLGACAIAVGILSLTPGKLPAVGDRDGAWEYYLKAWRPGKPRPERRHEAYQTTMRTVVDGLIVLPVVERSELAPKRITPSNEAIILAKQVRQTADIGWISNT